MYIDEHLIFARILVLTKQPHLFEKKTIKFIKIKLNSKKTQVQLRERKINDADNKEKKMFYQKICHKGRLTTTSF